MRGKRRLVWITMGVIVTVGLIAALVNIFGLGGDSPLESDQDRIEHWRSISGLYPIQQEEQYGFVNESGRVVINPQFERVGEFSEGLAPVKFNGKWGYINSKGAYVVNPQFDDAEPFFEDRAAIELENQWGYIDPKGTIVINPQFERADQFRDGRARVKQDNRWGFIDADGQYVINPQFDQAGVFTEGLAPVAVGSKVGYVDETGAYRINLQFDDAGPFHEHLGRVRSGERWGFVDKTGKYIINPQFSSAGDFHEGRALVRVGSRLGYIDRKGKFAINPQFNAGGDFKNGLAIVQIGERFGFVDHDGKVVINPQFESASPFTRKELALVSSEGKWGFLSRQGKVKISPQFSSANPFLGSLAFVEVDRFSGGYINTRGEFVWKREPPAKITEAIRLGRMLDDPSNQAVVQALRQFISAVREPIQGSWSSGNLDASSLSAQAAAGKEILKRIAALRQQIASESFTVTEVAQLSAEVTASLSVTESRLAELVGQLEAAPQKISPPTSYDALQQNSQVYGDLWRKLGDLEGDDPLNRGKNRVLQNFNLYQSDLQVARQQASMSDERILPAPPPPPPPPPASRASNSWIATLGSSVSDEKAQKRTVADIRNMGTAMFSWLTDQLGAGAAGQSQVDLRWYPVITRSELERVLVPQYVQKIPETDGWGHPYEFYLNSKNPQAKQVMSIRSPGRDGRFSAASYPVGSFPPSDYDEDVVWADGFFVRWPQMRKEG